MPWYQNFNNILSLMLIPAGLALIFWGNPEQAVYGPWLLFYVVGSAGTLAGSKVGSIMGGKKPPPAASFLLFFGLAAFSMGCVGFNTIPPDVYDLNLQVYDRHDKYIENDQTLDELDRRTYLRSTNILRKYLEANADAERTIIQPTPPPTVE
jgi:hypothetical protein